MDRGAQRATVHGVAESDTAAHLDPMLPSLCHFPRPCHTSGGGGAHCSEAEAAARVWRVSRSSCCFPAGAIGCYKHSLRLLWQRECTAPRWCSYLCACNGRVAGFLLFYFQSFPFPTPKTALKKKGGGGEEPLQLFSRRKRVCYRVCDLNQQEKD